MSEARPPWMSFDTTKNRTIVRNSNNECCAKLEDGAGQCAICMDHILEGALERGYIKCKFCTACFHPRCINMYLNHKSGPTTGLMMTLYSVLADYHVHKTGFENVRQEVRRLVLSIMHWISKSHSRLDDLLRHGGNKNDILVLKNEVAYLCKQVNKLPQSWRFFNWVQVYHEDNDEDESAHTMATQIISRMQDETEAFLFVKSQHDDFQHSLEQFETKLQTALKQKESISKNEPVVINDEDDKVRVCTNKASMLTEEERFVCDRFVASMLSDEERFRIGNILKNSPSKNGSMTPGSHLESLLVQFEYHHNFLIKNNFSQQVQQLSQLEAQYAHLLPSCPICRHSWTQVHERPFEGMCPGSIKKSGFGKNRKKASKHMRQAIKYLSQS